MLKSIHFTLFSPWKTCSLFFFPRKIHQKRRETSLSRWRRLLRAWGKRSRSWPEFFCGKVKSVDIWVIGSQEALNHQKISMLFKLQKHLKVCKKSTSQSNLHTAPFQDSPFRPARFFSAPLIKSMLQSCFSNLSASSTSVFCYPKWWSGSATTLWIYLSCWMGSLIWKASIFWGVKLSKSKTLRIHGEKCVVKICKAPSIYGLLHRLKK